MASTSSSSIKKNFKYDVFLSFRGEDTRKNFVDHLYHALKQKGIYTYKDDEEIKKGETISYELMRSIEDSKFYIIVFSKNYASSSWCLSELVKIMECQKTNWHTAYPVFYDVEPTEVRNQSGAVGKAFARHVNKEAAGRWRYALKEAADLAGWELKNTFDGHEAKFIQKLVEEISLELRFINSSIDGKLIGMETRMGDVVSSLELDNDDFRMIGIKGMGGIGKTTLARAVFDQISFQFEGSSFVENVRENSKNPACGVKSLQKQVLSDVLGKQDITINGVYEGKNMMKQRMGGIKVLVVLDDVDHTAQLEALAGEPSWFKPGSRVIVTTRDEQVLVAHEVPVNMILAVNLLSDEEANCLFNKYAFGRHIPNQGFEELAGQVVRYADGLPLTIKVLGSFLRGKDELELMDALKRLEKIPLKETLEILELSYCGLEDDYKEIFLDVACILKGWEKERAITVLESCDLHARSGLRVLEQKSLITLSSNGCLGMHDHIVEMGKHIVRRMYPNKPYKHSRLWIKEEIEDILVEDKGTKATRCIIVDFLNPVIVMKGLRKMNKLEFLRVDSRSYCFGYDDIDDDSLHLPNSLRYLSWSGYPNMCLPKTFLANNLVGLEMSKANIDQLWKDGDKKVLKKLRFLDLSYCKLRTLDMRLAMNLERFYLHNCSNLVEVCMPIEIVKLRFLSITDCRLIRTLDLKQAHNLETLEVEGCMRLENFNMPIEIFKLKFLSITYCRLIRILDLKQAHNLETLKVEGCMGLDKLHMPIETSKLKLLIIDGCEHISIRTLDLKRAHNLHTLTVRGWHLLELEMPMEISKLKHLILVVPMLKTINQIYKLKTLNLVCEHVVELQMPLENPKPKSINFNYSKLRTLGLIWAKNLDKLNVDKYEDLVELQLSLPKLKALSLRRCAKLKTIDLSQTVKLEMLYLEECSDLVELKMPGISPELKMVEIYSSNLRTLGLTEAHNLKRLQLFQCEDLLELHMPIASPELITFDTGCSKLRTLYLGPFTFPSDSVTLKPCLVNQGFPMEDSLAELHLIATSIYICRLHLENDLPMFSFKCIYKELQLSSTRNLANIISFGNCPCTNLASLPRIICGLQFRKLTLEGSIPEVPKELGQLESLEELSLLSTDIEHVPDGVCMLKHLRFLQLKSCRFLKKLPEDIGRLECLEELYVTDCTSLQDIPNSICEMKRLKCFHLTNCILVEKLPKEMGRLKCLKELNIQGTDITDFPPSISELEDLVFLR